MPKQSCAEEACGNPVKARGLCQKHYTAARRGRGYLPPLTHSHCLVEGCFKFSKAENGLCRKHAPNWKALRKQIGWEERWVFPTKPWLPGENSTTGVVHAEAWLRFTGGATLTAACMPSKLLESRTVENPKPCGKCVKMLRDHGLIA